MIRVRLFSLVCLMLLWLQCCTSFVNAQVEAPAAETLLRRMTDAYASTKSYSDNGVVFHFHKSKRDPDSTPFSIVFLRPDHLRFEMTNGVGSPYLPQTRSVLWSDGNSAQTWDESSQEVRTSRDAVRQISCFTGISSRSVHNVSSLLQKNFGWQEYLYQISSPRVVGEELFGGTNCYRIEGRGRAMRQFEIWIGKTDYLIRKIRTTHPDWQDEEIHENIVINQQISTTVFTFTPPGSREGRAKR